MGCVIAPGRLPIEFRLAIGASCRPDLFDGTAILNLCSRDPGISPPYGNLVSQTVHDGLDTIAAPRVGASKTAPEALFRTGKGVRIAWDITLRVETSRLGFIQQSAAVKPEVNDGSLWHLASLLALSAEDPLEIESGNPFPPYLFLTVNYQHPQEQWFRVELDPNASSASGAAIGPMEFNPETKTAERTLNVRLVTSENFKRVLPALYPSFNVNPVECETVTALPPLTAVPGGFQTSLTLEDPLPDLDEQGTPLGLMDGMLLNLANSVYGWKLFTITALSDDRITVTLFSPTNLSGAYLIGPSGPIGFRTVTRNPGVMLPMYHCTRYDNSVAARGPQTPYPSAFLIGDPTLL
jgi:hypothetical protein